MHHSSFRNGGLGLNDPFHVQNADRLDSEIIYDRDFDYDYFGFKVRGS